MNLPTAGVESCALPLDQRQNLFRVPGHHARILGTAVSGLQAAFATFRSNQDDAWVRPVAALRSGKPLLGLIWLLQRTKSA